MSIEWIILYIVWLVTLGSLFFVPKDRRKEASISFLFLQFLGWFLGLLVVELKWIEYPIRELAHVNRSSFTFEFLVFPAISMFFNLYYPSNRRLLTKIYYISLFTTGIIIPEIIFEKYTDLIKYIHWEWYYSWISVFFTLWIVRGFFSWFYKESISTQ
ncbi:CBO0543 family protein [Bacillus sp. 31A1R]|uniref:CBO0543 family protein n=1 Tax=Robertmurraya mangrovi TaxID=3098077 RepID=A0ABU5IWQ3_9BACI|nr:CBO0543 family protein [Bacillus sp. 31A1R]MDZ5471562.1 CBO0543 family protein [Bacillus sp. 31A1R]